MKYLLFVIVFLCLISGERINSQELSLDGMMGIKWGYSTSDVIKYFEDNNYEFVVIKPELISVKYSFNNLDLIIGITFSDNKAYSGGILINNLHKLNMKELYTTINSVLMFLKNIYGEPQDMLLEDRNLFPAWFIYHAAYRYEWYFNNNYYIRYESYYTINSSWGSAPPRILILFDKNYVVK